MPPPNPSIFSLVGHRGGESGLSSFIPEHSHAAYAIGASNGATYLEPDVISTKDHVLMVMHGNELSRTSDVSLHPEFADRYTTKFIDDGTGVTPGNVTGWFSEDFTWEEVSTLRLRTVNDDNPGPMDGIYGFLKFDEMLDYVGELSEQLGWKVGVYPETKLANYFASIDLPLEDGFVASLESHGYCGYDENKVCQATLADPATGPAVLQSFSQESLRRLEAMTEGLTTVCLINGGSVGVNKVSVDGKEADEALIKGIGEYSDVISIPTSMDKALFADVVTVSHDAGMMVHAWVADMDQALFTRLAELKVEGSFVNDISYARGALEMREAMLEEMKQEGESEVK